MFRLLKNALLIFLSASVLFACGDSDVPKEKMAASTSKETATQLSAEAPVSPTVEAKQEASTEVVYLSNEVVYEEAIYKDWPYTEAPVINAAMEVTEEVTQKVTEAVTEAKQEVETKVAEVKDVAKEKVTAVIAEKIPAVAEEKVVATVGDKPYQLVDGKISANVLEGWKTYNGGGCGTCHGKGAIGAVGPALGKSLTTKLSQDDFNNIVTNGKSGTMMRPHKTNKRVMDNLGNLYAYLLARGDDVIGPGNLIKSPLGK